MKFITVGAVAGTHGVDGEVKVRMVTEHPELFDDMEYLLLGRDGTMERSHEIESIRDHQDLLLIKLAGIDSKEQAALLTGMTVLLPENMLPETESDEIYWYAIEDAEVVDTEGTRIGLLKEYFEAGAADVFRILGDDGIWYLVSNNEHHVLKIDIEQKKIVIDRAGLVSEEDV